jgi:alpha-galactosidase
VKPENTLFSVLIDECSSSSLDITGAHWIKIPPVSIQNYWDGSLLAAPGKVSPNRVEIRSVWDKSHVWFRFESGFENLHVSPEWGEDGPIMNLWDADVVEVFLRKPGQQGYFEFEASPLNQWLDVRVITPRREVDFNWISNLDLQTDLDRQAGVWLTLFRIPFKNLLADPGQFPETGDMWRINLFRILGREPHRSYLAWRPTFTETPDFHVPDAFGNLLFTK